MRCFRHITPALLIAISAVSVFAQPARSFGPGTYLVGTDIEPGIYRAEGEVTYFARLSGLSGELADIIVNDAFPSSPVLIEIAETDIAFESKGSGQWNIVDDSYQPEVTAAISAGWWFVGSEIMPGLYRAEEGVTYFARLAGLSGELSDIIANDAFPDGPVVVEIKLSDAAFHFQGDGLWRQVDDTYRPSPRSVFGDGTWIVGTDILPGVYRTSDDVQYYARLSGFGGELSDIIVNEAFSEGGSIIEIMETDAGFLTQGGAVWTKVEVVKTFAQSASWASVKLKRNSDTNLRPMGVSKRAD